MKQLVLKTGVFRLSNVDNVKDNEFSFSKFLKRIFIKFGIAFTDPCCTITDIQPIRYNSATGEVEAYDGEVWSSIGTLNAIV